MPHLPLALTNLRGALDPAQRDTAWTQFVASYSDVLLDACRLVLRDRDAAMDAYVFVLEALHRNNCERLRAYVPDGTSQFSTWLLVVARRLALDYVRHKYGRSRSSDDARRAEDQTRRRLEDLVGEALDTDQILDERAAAPDLALRRAQLRAALQSAIEQLEPPDRLLLVLRFVDQRAVRDIARVLALPTVFHVYRRVAAVLAQLRVALARHGVDSPEP